MPVELISSDTLGFDPEDLKKYFYTLEMTWTDEESNSYEIPNRSVISFNVLCDYSNNIMPIYNIETVLNAYHYNLLQTNKSDLDIKIKLSHFMVDMEDGQINMSEVFSSGQHENATTLFETQLQPYVDHLVPLSGQDLLTIKNQSEDRDDDPLESEDNVEAIKCEFSLFNRDSMNIVKSNHNIILQDVTITDTIGVILTNAGVTKLIINKPDNTTSYEQLIIPPDNLVNTINYLQKTYGIYNTGVRKFIDRDDVFYFLSNNNGEIPVKKGEYPLVEIFVTDPSDSRGFMQGSLEDDENELYRIITGGTPNGNLSKSSANKEIVGSKIVFSNPKSKKYGTSYDDAGTFTFGSGVNVMAPSLESDITGDDKVSYLTNDEDNPILEYEMQYRMEEKNQFLTFTFEDVDMSIFTMNRKFKITFEDPQYEHLNSIYKLEKVNFIFTRTQSEIFLKCTVQAQFNIWPSFEIYNTRNDS